MLHIDAGAAQALKRGGSLLPVGTTAVSGTFERGDAVRVANPDGTEIARGIVNYGSRDLARIAGARRTKSNRFSGTHFGD